MSVGSDNNSDSDFEDPDFLEVPGGGKNLATLSSVRKPTGMMQPTVKYNSTQSKSVTNVNSNLFSSSRPPISAKNSSFLSNITQQLKRPFMTTDHDYTNKSINSNDQIAYPVLPNLLQFNSVEQSVSNLEHSQEQDLNDFALHYINHPEKLLPTPQDLNFSLSQNDPVSGLLQSIQHHSQKTPVFLAPSEGENTEEEGMGVAEIYATYMPSKLKIGVKHPDPVVESTSLSSVEPVDVWYELLIPKTVISTAMLSALQLEAITYACQQHEVILPSGMRAGFLIGDGAGVGKGRTIAGLIYENYLRGRKKSIWISIMNDLKYDSERDLTDIGARIPVHQLNKMKYIKIHSPENGNVKKGVLFCTYSSLIAHTVGHTNEFENRLDQILEWCGPKFDGVIVFDECHRAKNLCPLNSGKATKTGLKVLQLQLKLPLARIVYASATGATEPRNMAYMVRLNLWGPGTPYPDFNVFLNVFQKRGVGAMEIVAMEMKLRGLYIARQLSFQGVIFKICEVALSKQFKSVYNIATNLWNEVFHKFQEAVDIIKADKSIRTYIWGQFWSAHQRFFRYMCISAKVSDAVLIARDAIKCGKCVVIGLQSTGEARTLSQLEKDDGELSDFVSTANGVILSLVENHFPLVCKDYENKPLADNFGVLNKPYSTNKRKKIKLSDNTDSLNLKTSEGLSDSESDEFSDVRNGKSFPSDASSTLTKLTALKQDLLKKIDNLGKRLPPNALDELIDELGGPENVAEMTGRKGRVVHSDGTFKYEARSVNDVPLEILNLKEKQRFMDGKKDVAIISEAASSGISLHSDKRAKNRRCRVHITLELPWSADRAIQQFGRTHRSNQSNAPEYVLLISELGGERRFASVVAKRLESLGALTQGDRRATEARDLSKYNIDNNYGRTAVELTLKSISGFVKPIVSPPINYKGNFIKDALNALVEVGMISHSESNSNSFSLDCDRKTFAKFLNRILGIKVELQNAIFDYFTNTMEAIIERAKKFGHYDLGILDVAAEDKCTKRIMVSSYERKEINGTIVTELHKVSVERGMNWEDAFQLWSNYSGSKDGFYYSLHEKTNNKEIILAILERKVKNKGYHVEEEDAYTVYRPNVGQQLKKDTIKNILKKFKTVEMDEAERLWNSHYKASLFTCSHLYWNGMCKRTYLGQECDVGLRNKTYYILSGSVLSIWNSLETIISNNNGSRLQVVRVKTKDGDKIVGTLVPSSCVENLHNELKRVANKYTTKQF